MVLLWFRDGKFYAGGEDGLAFYNLSNYLGSMTPNWFAQQGGMQTSYAISNVPVFSLFAVVQVVFGNPVLSQALLFFILLAIGLIGAFVFAYHITSNEDTALVAAIFYFLNPLTMSQIWGRGLYFLFFSWALIPLCIYFAKKFLDNKEFKSLIYFVIASTFLTPAFTSPTTILILWIPITLYALFSRKNIFSLSLLAITWTILNLWWITTFLNLSSQSFSLGLSGDITQINLASLRTVSTDGSLDNVLRFFHEGIFFRTAYYGSFYQTSLIKIASFIPTLLLFIGALVVMKRAQHRWVLLSFVVILAIALGSNPPFGKIFEYFFVNFTFFQSLRNPYEKMGPIFALYFTFIASVGFTFIVSKFPKGIKNLSIVLFLIFLSVFNHPYFTSKFAGGNLVNSWISIPHDYKLVRDSLRDNNASYVLSLPIIPGDGVRFNWDFPYQGVNQQEALLSTHSLSRNTGVNKRIYNPLLTKFDVFSPNTFGPDPEISKEVLNLNFEELVRLYKISHIVVHKDINSKLSGSASLDKTISEIQKANFGKILETEKLVLYATGNDWHALETETKQLISQENYWPKHFLVTVDNSNTKTITLNYLNNDNWIAEANDGLRLSRDTSDQTFNTWNLPANFKGKVKVYYGADYVFLRNLQISILGYAILLVMLLIFAKRKNYEKKKQG